MRKIGAFIWYQRLHFNGWIQKWSGHTPLTIVVSKGKMKTPCTFLLPVQHLCHFMFMRATLNQWFLEDCLISAVIWNWKWAKLRNIYYITITSLLSIGHWQSYYRSKGVQTWVVKLMHGQNVEFGHLIPGKFTLLEGNICNFEGKCTI